MAEALNILDEGTSILLHSQVRTDFTAETLLEALAGAIRRYGLPRRITLDRDPRSVGAPTGSDFPSALVRFGTVLGIEMQICAPRHPWENGFIERYHRSYQQECLSIERPQTLLEARGTTERWVEHYNQERPNLELPRIWGVGKEKFGTIRTGGYDGQNSTDLYQRIQAASGSFI